MNGQPSLVRYRAGYWIDFETFDIEADIASNDEKITVATADIKEPVLAWAGWR